VTYGEDQNQIQLVETIRQNLPLTYDGEAPDYQIEIGFQLTEEQLFYNTSQDDN
jgi:cytochrome c biogenesis protein ResB